MVDNADLPCRIGEQAPDDGRADRAGAARHQDAGHQWPLSGAASTDVA